MISFDREQTRRFLKVARGDRLEALYVLAVTAGLRQGELLGLKWSDLNLKEGTLTVKRSLRIDKNGPRFTEGKRDRSRRCVDLGASTVTALKAHRKRQNEEHLRYAGLREDQGLVFCKEDSGSIRACNMDPRLLR